MSEVPLYGPRSVTHPPKPYTRYFFASSRAMRFMVLTALASVGLACFAASSPSLPASPLR